MKKVTATQLKTKLGLYMRTVKLGGEVVVTDRGQPIARLLPFRTPASAVESAPVAVARDVDAPPLGRVQLRPISYRGKTTLDYLREDRSRR